MSEKVELLNIIASINASAEVALIALSKVDMGSFSHNTIGGRTEAGCHPQSAITNLVTDLSTLGGRVTALENQIGGVAGDVAQLQSNDNCLASAVAQLFNNAGLPVPPCVQALT